MENHVKAIKKFINNSSFADQIISFEAQGSWRHETIIQPVAKKEYDADLLIMCKRNRKWSSTDYLNNLYKELRSSKYKNKVSRKTRCVTINYSGDFHLDLVPCVHDIAPHFIFFEKSKFQICNRAEGEFEQTDGTGFAEWLDEKKRAVHSNMLVKTVQLFKYLRDHK